MQVVPQGGPHHAFLFMSDPDSSQTTVMRLGDGMDRVVPDDDCGIMFTAPTVAAANILDHTRIIQVQRCCCTWLMVQLYCTAPALMTAALSARAGPSGACPALLCPALPCCAPPHPALPCPALPCPALPCPALPCLAPPCLALPCLPCFLLPYVLLAERHLTKCHLTQSRR